MSSQTPRLVKAKSCDAPGGEAFSRVLTPRDHEDFLRLTDPSVSPGQQEALKNPSLRLPRQQSVLGVHWHPENVPLPVIKERMAAMYPGRQHELVIPTQHNELLSYDGYAGVEIDCYSHGFNRKVQLLVHMREDALDKAGVLRNMLRHTFKYRSSQFFEYLDALCAPAWQESRHKAAAVTGADEDVVEFAATHAWKLKALVHEHEGAVPKDALKNKLVRNFIDTRRDCRDHRFIAKVQSFAKAVKEIVKEGFSFTYFYRASEVIEEARSIGAGLVIPHPEQFWPILLRNYDVDGIEVWNPQSRQYTEFLITVVLDQNRRGYHKDRPLLIFMGDDCHFSEKLRDPAEQDPDKASREVGLQPAWDDLSITKGLIMAGISRETVIAEYRARLG